jgi:uncharacterized protein (TIGR00369 family)
MKPASGKKAVWDARQLKRAFASGFTSGMKLKLVSARKGRLVLAMAHAPELVQPFGLIHGGAIATLADTAAGAASWMLLPEGQSAVTSELKINYVGNITKGVLEAEAILIHYGRRTLVWEVKVREAKTRALVAITLTTFFILTDPNKA